LSVHAYVGKITVREEVTVTRYSRRERIVSAMLRDDGTVYLDMEQDSKPVSVHVLGWTLAALWLVAGAVLIAAILSV
jgi:hypothetical protein